MFTDVDGDSPADLRAAYTESLRTVIDEVGGVAAASRASEVAAETVEAAREGDLEAVSLAEASAIAALAADRDADALAAAARDAVLLGMANAVMDVESLARDLDADLDAREIQQKIEGRFPITLGEYACVRAAIARRRQA